MKILILSWRDPKNPLGGGAEVMTQRFAAGWVKAGHAVVQFSSSFPGAKSEETLEGVKIIRRGSHFTVHLLAWWSFLRQRFGKVDLIVDEIHFIPFFSPLFAPRTKRIAFIFELAKEVWFENLLFPFSLFGFLTERFFYCFYRQTPFFTDSMSTKKDLSAWGIPEDRIEVLEPGIDLKPLIRVPVKDRRPKCLYLGSLVKDKGIEDALTAFGLVARKKPEVRFWVVGQGKKEYESQLKNKAREAGIQNKTIFWGFVSEAKKRELLQRAHLLFHPSRREGWGIVVLEANSQATPVIGYNVVGLRDSIKNGQTGILTDKNTPEVMASQALSLLSQPRRYRRFQEAGLVWAQNHRWEAVVEKSRRLVELVGGKEK